MRVEAEKSEITRDGDYDVQKAQVYNELRDAKAQWREAYYSKIDKQKQIIQNHTRMVDLSKKCRKMYELIGEYSKLSEKQRNELKMGSNDNLISQEQIDKMEQEIKLANERMKNEERNFEEKVTAQAQQIKDKEYELRLIQLKLKEKDKEVRL